MLMIIDNGVILPIFVAPTSRDGAYSMAGHGFQAVEPFSDYSGYPLLQT